jgi:hypothetical protein
MGYLRPTVLVVTGLYEHREKGVHWASFAREVAVEIFSREQTFEGPLPVLGVSEVSPPLWNNARSFAIWWDGSKEGWDASNVADAVRAEFVEWLREQAFEDGSSPLRWVEVAYADDDGLTMVLATSADQKNAMRSRENVIHLEIEEELKSALEWAELDGVIILDPDGWRDGVDELVGDLPLETRIGRGEFERRLAASTVMPGRV